MRLAGEMLKATELVNGSRGVGKKIVESNNSTSLSDLGLTKNESSTYQKIASIPLDEFESEMSLVKDGLLNLNFLLSLLIF